MYSAPGIGTSSVKRASPRRIGSSSRRSSGWSARAEHTLRFEREPVTGGLKPYLHVRRDLWAKGTRALFYDLVELGEEHDVDGKRMFGVASAGEFFAMAPADELEDSRHRERVGDAEADAGVEAQQVAQPAAGDVGQAVHLDVRAQEVQDRAHVDDGRLEELVDP